MQPVRDERRVHGKEGKRASIEQNKDLRNSSNQTARDPIARVTGTSYKISQTIDKKIYSAMRDCYEDEILDGNKHRFL